MIPEHILCTYSMRYRGISGEVCKRKRWLIRLSHSAMVSITKIWTSGASQDKCVTRGLKMRKKIYQITSLKSIQIKQYGTEK